MKYGVLFLLLLIAGCGNGKLYSKSDAQQIRAGIHVVPQELLGITGFEIPAGHTTMIPLGKSAEFWGLLELNGETLAIELPDSLPYKTYWTLGKDSIMNNPFRKTFDQAGIDTLVYHVIDQRGDTLHDTMEIFVNTPLTISPLQPAPDRLDVSPSSSQELAFIWNLQGVDSWETPLVRLTLAPTANEIESAFPLDSTSSDNLTVSSRGACPTDSSCRFWWKLVATVHSALPPSTIDSAHTDNLFFQTRRLSTDFVQMKIGLSSNAVRIGGGVWVHSIHSAYQTQVNWMVDTVARTATSPLMPAGTWLVIAGDSLHSDIEPDSLQVILPAGIYHNQGTLLELNDNIPPQIMYLNTTAPSTIKDSLVFELFDFGSGVDTNSISVSASTLQVSRKGTKLTLSWSAITNGTAPAQIRIIAKDFAANSTENSYWKTQISSGHIILSGPFFDPPSKVSVP